MDNIIESGKMQTKWYLFIFCTCYIVRIYALGENLGEDPEEVKLQNASKQVVETVILQAVQQISKEEMKEENRQNKNSETLTASRSNGGHGKKWRSGVMSQVLHYGCSRAYHRSHRSTYRAILPSNKPKHFLNVGLPVIVKSSSCCETFFFLSFIQGEQFPGGMMSLKPSERSG